MMGRRVATLVNADQGAGSYETIWNARNDAGSPVASGVYIYRIQAGLLPGCSTNGVDEVIQYT